MAVAPSHERDPIAAHTRNFDEVNRPPNHERALGRHIYTYERYFKGQYAGALGPAKRGVRSNPDEP